MANNERKTSIIVGTFFLVAMVTSLLGGGLIESVLGAPDYLNQVYTNRSLVVSGVLLELVNSIAVVGIAVFMFPLFKKYSEALALGYFGFRTIEAVIAVAAVLSPLAMIALSQEYLAAGPADAAYFQTVGSAFIAARAYLVGQILGIFFSLGALVFYYLLYQSKLVPRFISIWGLIGAVLILFWNLLEIFGIQINAGMILALPIILNEIFLGIWLIFKGFNPFEIAAEQTTTDANTVRMGVS